MNFIIICFVCIALILVVIFFAKRHMQKVTQAYEQEQKDALVSVSDLERVAKGGKSSRTYDAERQRTRRLSVFFIAVIVIIGAAAAIFDSYKQELFEDWSQSSTEQKTTEKEVSFSIGNYFATYFSHEKALRYYGTKRRMAYEKAQAQCHEYEVKLKQAEEQQDKVEIIIQQEKLAEAKAKLDSTKENWDNFEFFPRNWRINTNLNWLLLFLFVVGSWNLYYINKKPNLCVFTIIISFFAFALGLVVPVVVFAQGYQEEWLFTLRDIIGIILTIWCIISFRKMIK